MKHESPQFFYRAFGLSIASEFEIEGVSSGPVGSDVVVRLGELEPGVFETELRGAEIVERPGTKVWVTPASTCYAWDGFGRALVREGREIIVEPVDGIDPTEFSPFVTGALFGHLLHQLHQTVLHGSSVRRNGETIVFLGDKGAGKSTVAVSMLDHGFSMVTDDLVPITIENGEVTTRAGFPRAKLWPDSIESLGLEPESLPRIMSFIDKRSLPVDNDLDLKESVDRIFVMREGNSMTIRLLGKGEAFFELNRNLYLVQYLQSTGATARDFRCCELIANSVPIYMLERPHEFSRLRKVSELVADHISSD